MIFSRRTFFTGLATLIAAPAIVRAESLMKLAPTKITRASTISMREITEYAIGENNLVSRLDVLYGSLQVQPEWTVAVSDLQYPLDELSARILAPMMNRLSQQIADAVMYGSGVVFAENNSHALHHVPLAGLLREARATNSYE